MSLLLAASLLVISVDGLDQRYLENADQLGLKIPNLRKLTRQGQWSRGVVGVVPTVTWPSHTTIITGAEAYEHGILSNKMEGGDYYWDVNLLKRPTLLDATKHLRTAVITWPVTVNAPVTFNLPEYFKRRRGGAMDTPSICSKAKPADLCTSISKRFPSFEQEWMDDRTRTLAVRYFLEVEKADLILVHLVDLDSEAHTTGPFSKASNAMLEYQDELIGTMLTSLPKGGRVALVSDHGFEAGTTDVHLLTEAPAGVKPYGGYVAAENETAAAWLESKKSDARYGIGRRIPADEIARFAPRLTSAKAVYEPAEHFWFGSGNAKLINHPHETGNHGHWPTRYRAVYSAWGPGIKPGRLPELSMKQIYENLRGLLTLSSTIRME